VTTSVPVTAPDAVNSANHDPAHWATTPSQSGKNKNPLDSQRQLVGGTCRAGLLYPRCIPFPEPVPLEPALPAP